MFVLTSDGTIINLDRIIQIEKPNAEEGKNKTIIRTGFGSIFCDAQEYDKILGVMCQKKIITL